MNAVKTTALLALMTGVLLGLGELVAGPQGVVTAFFIAAAMNFVSYFFSDSIVLRSYGAQEVGPDHRLYRIVAALAQRAGLPQPRCYVIPDPSPNAFATGRNPHHPAVPATHRILQLPNDDELAGVLGHALARP